MKTSLYEWKTAILLTDDERNKKKEVENKVVFESCERYYRNNAESKTKFNKCKEDKKCFKYGNPGDLARNWPNLQSFNKSRSSKMKKNVICKKIYNKDYFLKTITKAKIKFPFS